MFDAIPILIGWLRCTFRGFLSRFWSLCGAVQKICKNLYQSAPDKIHLSSDFTNKFQELNFPNTEKSFNWSAEMSGSYHDYLIRRESTSAQSYLKNICWSILIIKVSLNPLIFVRAKSRNSIFCSLKLLTFQSLLQRGPLQGLQSVAIKVSSCYIILAYKIDLRIGSFVTIQNKKKRLK